MPVPCFILYIYISCDSVTFKGILEDLGLITELSQFQDSGELKFGVCVVIYIQ